MRLLSLPRARRAPAPGWSTATASIPLFDGWLDGADVDPEALEDLRRRAAALEGAVGIPLSDVEPVAPISDPGKVVCVGLNYREHASRGRRPAPDQADPVLEVRQCGHRRR